MEKRLNPYLQVKQKSSIYFCPPAEGLRQLVDEGRRLVVISDQTVAPLFPELRERYPFVVIGIGEREKSLSKAHHLYKQFIRLGVDRSWLVVGLGGGIVCDMAGFVASTYMRGLDFAFIPTTLLSQVDASIGGKNGVNIGGYKNMVGTFSQPSFVICDSGLLDTLPPREFCAGLAEIAKAAIIGDSDLFALLERHPWEKLRNQEALLTELVQRAIRIKAAIVERDEKEQQERKLLNLGHTFAHGIEKLTKALNHGEAVGIGLCMAATMALRLGLLPAATCERIHALVNHLGLPQQINLPTKRLVQAMAKDKKGVNGTITLILPTEIGHCAMVPMTPYEIEQLLT